MQYKTFPAKCQKSPFDSYKEVAVEKLAARGQIANTGGHPHRQLEVPGKTDTQTLSIGGIDNVYS